jgi:DedD protein
MAIFSTRSGKRDAEQAPTKNVPLDSIETLRTRARQRLIGAVVLVALGIITFTLLFDSQPRPIPVDIQITMPDKDNPGATVTSGGSASVASVASAVSAADDASRPVKNEAPKDIAKEALTKAVDASAVQASASLDAKEEIVAPKTEKKPETKLETKQEVKAEPKVETKSIAKPEVKPEAKPVAKPATNDEAAKALAILEGKEPPKAAASPSTDVAERFIVQFGAFAENEKAREARLKVERAGMKTYVHVAVTPDGKLIRVRSGPFTTRAEAEKVAAKIKSLGLNAAILTL